VNEETHVQTSPTTPRRPTRPSARLALALVTALAAVGLLGPPAGAEESPSLTPVADLRLGSLAGIAFEGDTAVALHAAGNWSKAETFAGDGIIVLDVERPEAPVEVARLTCSAMAWDLSLAEDLVITSTFAPVDSPACDAKIAPDRALVDAWWGLRIFSVADPANPELVGSFRTACASHTHTVIPDGDRLIVYSSPHLDAFPTGRPSIEGGSCQEVVEIPLGDPAAARSLGFVDTLHPLGGCHDVTVFLPRGIAGAACNERSQIWDISDPADPVVIAEIPHVGFVHHSSAFTDDGATWVLGMEDVGLLSTADEGFGCTLNREGQTGITTFDVTDPRNPVARGHLLEPTPAGAGLCMTHDLAVVPTSGDRDVLAVPWLGAGTSLVDVTDPSAPTVLDHHVFSPADPAERSVAWSASTYRGHLFVPNTDINDAWGETDRGLDVYRLDGFDDLVETTRFNGQTQEALEGVEVRPRPAGGGLPELAPLAPPPGLPRGVIGTRAGTRSSDHGPVAGAAPGDRMFVCGLRTTA
jgi:hypothetical protein